MIALLLQVVVVEQAAEWKADVDTVRSILTATARELFGHAKADPATTIRVSPKGGPIVLFKRAEDGAFVVKLNTGESYWAQYVFQFGHEVTHVLTGVKPKTHRHAWLEESICEVGSLFCLRRAVETWKKTPPYPGAADFCPSLADYAAKRLAEVKAPRSLALWLVDHRAEMEKNPEDRPRNRVVAAALLPLFEAEPSGWETMRHFPADGGPELTLPALLEAWRLAAPARLHPFLERLASALSTK